MKVAIIEDEPLAVDHLTQLIHQYDTGIKIIYQCDSVKKAVQWFLTEVPVDLVFLDIQLADGLSFDIFEQANVPIPIIFTTAYNEYAIKAFKVNSIDYLLKPIDLEGLTSAIDKYKSWAPQEPPIIPPSTIAQLASLLDQQEAIKQRFIVKVGEHIHSISVDEIAFFYSKEKATFLQTQDQRRYLIDYSLEQLEAITDSSRFFRINRAFLITVEATEDIINYSNSRLKLRLKKYQDDNIVVSRDRVQSFKKWLDR